MAKASGGPAPGLTSGFRGFRAKLGTLHVVHMVRVDVPEGNGAPVASWRLVAERERREGRGGGEVCGL